MSKFSRLRETVNNTEIDVFALNSESKEYETPNGLPSSVKVLGQTFTVRYRTHIYFKPNKKSRLRGVVLYYDRIIVIDPDQSIHNMRQTLYHEMAHVYLRIWQEKNTALRKLTAEQVEEVCDLFGDSFYDCLANNLLQS